MTLLLSMLPVPIAFGQVTDRGAFVEQPEPEAGMKSGQGDPWGALSEALAQEPIGFAFYWGEWLSDEIEEQSQEVVEGQRSSSAQRWSGFEASRSDYWEIEAASQGRFRIVEREEVVSISDRSELASGQLWRVESAFVSTLAPHGMRLIDPGLAVRRQSAQQREVRDRRRLETDALIGDATHVLEVLGRRDASRESGWEFRVRVTDIAGGHRLVDFTTAAIPPSDYQPRYVASDRGFEVDEGEPPEPEDFGRELARQLALRLLEVI